MHNEQVLVDGEHTVCLKTLGHLGVTVETRDRELLLRTLILLHEDFVFDLPVAHVWFADVRIRCLVGKPDKLLRLHHEQYKEDTTEDWRCSDCTG